MAINAISSFTSQQEIANSFSIHTASICPQNDNNHSVIDFTVPGNRLIEDRGNLTLIPKTPGEVIGERVLRPLIKAVESLGYKLFKTFSFLPGAKAETIEISDSHQIEALEMVAHGIPSSQYVLHTDILKETFNSDHLVHLYRTGDLAKGKALIQLHKLNPQFSSIFSLGARELSLNSQRNTLQTYFDDLFHEPYDLAVSCELQLLAKCFEECQDPSSIQQWRKFVSTAETYIRTVPLEGHVVKLLQGSSKLLDEKQIQDVIIEGLTGRKAGKSVAFRTADVIFGGMLTDAMVARKGKFTSIITRLAQQGKMPSERIMNALIENALPPLTRDFAFQDRTNEALVEIAKSGGVFPIEGIQELVKFFVNSSNIEWNARYDVANAIGEITEAGNQLSEETILDLIQVFDNPRADWVALGGAADALGGLAKATGEVPKEAVQGLIKVLTNSDTTVNTFSRVAAALAKIAKTKGEMPEEAVQGLIKILAKPNSELKTFSLALWALTEIANVEGQLPQNIAPELLRISADPKVNWYERIKAGLALDEKAKEKENFSKELLQISKQILYDFNADIFALSQTYVILNQIVKTDEKLNKEFIQDLVEILDDSNRNQHARNVAKATLEAKFKAGEHLPNEALSLIDINKPEKESLREAIRDTLQILGDSDAAWGDRMHAAYVLAGVVKEGKDLPKETVQMVVQFFVDSRASDWYNFRALLAGKSAIGALEEMAKAGLEFSREGVQLLAQALDSSNYGWGAALTLGEIAKARGDFSKEAYEALVQLFDNSNAHWYDRFFKSTSYDDAREGAAIALGEISQTGRELPKEALRALLQASANPKRGAQDREKAFQALNVIPSSNLAALVNEPSSLASVIEICALSSRAMRYFKGELALVDEDGEHPIKRDFDFNLEGIEKVMGIHPISWRPQSQKVP